MIIKEKVEDRWLKLRNTIQARRTQLEEMREAFKERVIAFRSSWKIEVFRRVDQVFCLAMETLERSINRMQLVAPGLKGGQYLPEEQPVMSSGDWIQ